LTAAAPPFPQGGGLYGPAYQQQESMVPFYEVLRQLTSNSNGPVRFQYNKMLIALAPLQVSLCSTEFGKHNIYQGMSRLLVALLAPHVRKSGDDALRERFKTLKGHTRTCGLVRVGIVREGETDYNDTFKFITRTSLQHKDDDLEVQTTEKNMDVGREVAKENGYASVNCSAVDVFYELMEIAAELGLIRFDDELVIDNREAKPEELMDEEARMRRVKHGGQ
jgi:hypothetical protein